MHFVIKIIFYVLFKLYYYRINQNTKIVENAIFLFCIIVNIPLYELRFVADLRSCRSKLFDLGFAESLGSMKHL